MRDYQYGMGATHPEYGYGVVIGVKSDGYLYVELKENRYNDLTVETCAEPHNANTSTKWYGRNPMRFRSINPKSLVENQSIKTDNYKEVHVAVRGRAPEDV
jgi:hypothetical protein